MTILPRAGLHALGRVAAATCFISQSYCDGDWSFGLLAEMSGCAACSRQDGLHFMVERRKAEALRAHGGNPDRILFAAARDVRFSAQMSVCHKCATLF